MIPLRVMSAATPEHRVTHLPPSGKGHAKSEFRTRLSTPPLQCAYFDRSGLARIVDQLKSHAAVGFAVHIDGTAFAVRCVPSRGLRWWCPTGGHQLDGLVHVGNVHTQMVEPFAVLLPVLYVDVRSGNLLHPLERRVTATIPPEPHLVGAGLAAIDAVEADVVVDPRKGFEAEARIVCVHLSHVIHDPGEMGDLGDGILVARAGGHYRARPSVWVIDQPEYGSPALGNGVKIGQPAPACLSLPVVLHDHTRAFSGEVLDLVVELLGRSDVIAEDANAITAFKQAVAPELASAPWLNPFDLELADVSSNLLRARWVGLAAISQIRETHYAVAMDIVDT